jgi:hypothetical protein
MRFGIEAAQLRMSVVAFLVMGSGATPAVADTEAEARRGFLAGFSVGGGTIYSTGAGGETVVVPTVIDVRLGASLGNSFAVMTEVIGEGTLSVLHLGFYAAAQYWPLKRLWVRAGLGVDHADTSDEAPAGMPQTTELGGLAAIGFELYSQKSFAIDLQLRGTTMITSGQVMTGARIHTSSLGLSFNWY